MLENNAPQVGSNRRACNHISAFMLTAAAFTFALFAFSPQAQAVTWKTSKTLDGDWNIPSTDIALRTNQNGKVKMSFSKKNIKSKSGGDSIFKWNSNSNGAIGSGAPSTYGIYINFSKLKNSSKLVLIFPKIAVDDDGYVCDMQLTLTDWETKITSGWSNRANIGFESSAGAFWYRTPDTSFSANRGSLRFRTTVQFFRHGTSTPSSGKAFVMYFQDLDSPSAGGAYRTGYAEGIKLRDRDVVANSSGKATAIIHSQNWLDTAAGRGIPVGTFWNGRSTYATNDTNEKKAAFATVMKNGGSFIWQGNHAWTQIFRLGKTASLKKRTDSHSVLGYLENDSSLKTRKSWKTDIVPYKSNRTYAFAAKAGYAVTGITITDKQGKLKDKTLKTSSSQISPVSGETYKGNQVYRYKFKNITGDTGRIYVKSAKIKDAKISLNVKKTVSGPGATLKKGQFTFILYNDNGKKLGTATNNASGDVVFNSSNTNNKLTIDDMKDGETRKIRYTIKEENAGETINGWKYSNNVYSVEVTLKTNGTKVDVTQKVVRGSSTFNNEFTYTPVSTQLVATKKLKNATLKKNQFTFSITAQTSGAPMPSSTTAKNDASGNITFKSIKFTAPGTYVYNIKETTNSGNGVTVDTGTVVATVKVKQAAAGSNELAATVSYKKGSASSKQFVNTYSATGNTTLTVTKSLKNETLSANQFSFTLSDAGGNVLDTKKNNASGTVSFPLSYTHADAGKKYKYVITEKNTGGNYEYDTHKVNVSVSVTDNGNGTLSFAVSYSGNKTFTNVAPIFGGVKFKKVGVDANNNETPLAGAKFVITDTNNKIIKDNITTPASGIITVDNLPAGSYKLYEKTAPAGYNKTTVTKTFSITQNNQVVDLTSSPFKNPQKTAEAIFEAEKILNGKALGNEPFSFQLLDNNGTVLQTKSNDENGQVEFDPIPYNSSQFGQTFTYKVKEVNDSANRPYYTFDTTEYTVTSTPDATTGVPVIQYLKGSTPITTDVPQFTNNYNASGSVTLTANKQLIDASTGNAHPFAAGLFHFEVLDENEQVIATATNNAAGNISFPNINYAIEDIGSHYYTIREVQSALDGITCDFHEEGVEVIVEDDGQGHLTTQAVYDDDGAEFVNTYDPHGNITLSVTKELEGATLADGQFPFMLYDSDGQLIMPESDAENPEAVSARNAANGRVVFPTLNFTREDIPASGTLTKMYTVFEDPFYDLVDEQEEPSRYIYDRHICYITVTAQMVENPNGTGTIQCSAIYSPDPNENAGEGVPRSGDASSVVYGASDIFKNVYQFRGGVKIRKVDQDNHPLEGIGFSLYYSDTAIFMGELMTDENGYAQTEPDALMGGDYFLVETGAPAGSAPDAAKIPFSITEDGMVDLSSAPIVNRPKHGVARIHVNKVLEYGNLTAGQFTFQLVDSSGAVVDTAVNDAEGNVNFVVEYTYEADLETGENNLGEHRYTIQEVKGSDPDITYDLSEKTAIVMVTEMPMGLSCSVDYKDDAEVQ